MRASGLYSAMGLLTDLSRSCQDLTNSMGLGLINACWDGDHQLDEQQINI